MKRGAFVDLYNEGGRKGGRKVSHFVILGALNVVTHVCTLHTSYQALSVLSSKFSIHTICVTEVHVTICE